jgi:hypothetical protein
MTRAVIAARANRRIKQMIQTERDLDDLTGRGCRGGGGAFCGGTLFGVACGDGMAVVSAFIILLLNVGSE